MNRRRISTRLLATAAMLTLAACTSTSTSTSTSTASTTPPASTATAAANSRITLVTYDSFPVKDTSLNEAIATFTATTGIGVDILVAGDAGTMVSKAALTSGTPEGDVMWGVDNTLLSRALDAKVFQPYTSTELKAIDPALTALVPGHELTPVDFGDVCLNYDIAWYHDHAIAPPTSFDQLTDPKYRDQLVVENPASSSPGLVFLLATVAKYGDSGWQQYWKALRANGVKVVDSWESAYYEQFSGSSGKGPRPLVVSYGSSPPAEVIFADPPRTDAPTAVIADTCFRQVEFAGVLRGTTHQDEAQRLVDFLAGTTFQQEVALNLFVYPARTDVALPAAFTSFSVVPGSPLTMAPSAIAANREQWVDEWTQLVIR
jgi:thiamine transport system substrate-binding protein